MSAAMPLLEHGAWKIDELALRGRCIIVLYLRTYMLSAPLLSPLVSLISERRRRWHIAFPSLTDHEIACIHGSWRGHPPRTLLVKY